jgi:SAM-dependent methyltransferase
MGGAFDVMMRHVRRSLELGPATDREWARVCRLLPAGELAPEDARFRPQLEKALTVDAVDAHDLVTPVMALLRADVMRVRRLRKVEVLGNEGRAWMTDPLLLGLLRRAVVVDEGMEALLTRWRRWLLEAVEGGARLGVAREFVSALATQCFNNEYAFAVSAAEEKWVERCGTRKPSMDRALLLACYRPLSAFTWVDEWMEEEHPAHVRALLVRQVEEPREERRIRAELTVNPPSGNETSAVVRAQYEESPYPRWVTLEKQEPMGLRENLELWFPHVRPLQFPQKPRGLIAGCGTGRHAILRASRYVETDYLAVDLSLSSLSYAARKAAEHRVDNLRFQQADILALPDAWGPFDVIECGGVLNCFDDALLGWRRLTEKLAKGGVMCIALYSWHARKVVRQVWEQLDVKARSMTVEDVRAARQKILGLPDGHPLRVLGRFPDFYSLSGCRDLLFHVQELQFTLPQIKEMIESLELEFLGFEHSQPFLGRAYQRRFPEDSRGTDLLKWDVFEQEHPEVFAGMYQFWCRKPG